MKKNIKTTKNNHTINSLIGKARSSSAKSSSAKSSLAKRPIDIINSDDDNSNKKLNQNPHSRIIKVKEVSRYYGDDYYDDDDDVMINGNKIYAICCLLFSLSLLILLYI